MPAWVITLLSAIASIALTIAKGIFGTDKPQQVTTDEKPSPLPPTERDQVFKNLGLPPTPAPDDRMHDRPDN